ncbi:MAG: GNAT family N-acetyltransferase [Clostridia bacterium]|nr:GNAT family N-acetyltransferase [Clostridia bacterium]
METVFESDSIRYVRVTEELVKDYLAMVNDIQRVARFIGDRTEAIPEDKELSWIRGKREENAFLFSMIEKKSGAFIGNIELMDVKDGTGELGIAVTGDKQDLGYGQEAVRAMTAYGFDSLGLARIFLKVYPNNARAIHVYEKCGFREYDCTEKDIFMEITR